MIPQNGRAAVKFLDENENCPSACKGFVISRDLTGVISSGCGGRARPKHNRAAAHCQNRTTMAGVPITTALRHGPSRDGSPRSPPGGQLHLQQSERLPPRSTSSSATVRKSLIQQLRLLRSHPLPPVLVGLPPHRRLGLHPMTAAPRDVDGSPTL